MRVTKKQTVEVDLDIAFPIEILIGSTFNIRNTTFHCCRFKADYGSHCDLCVFNEDSPYNICDALACRKQDRLDGNAVYFIKGATKHEN